MILDTPSVGSRPAIDPSLPSLRCGAAACFNGQKVVLFGGQNEFSQPEDDTWVFDTSGGWTRLHPEPKPPARAFAGMAYDSTRAILFGGYHKGVEFADTWAFDGSEWTQLEPNDHPSARHSFGMASFGKYNDIVLFGGLYLYQPVPAETWRFVGGEWGQIDGQIAPTPRGYPAMCSDNNGMQAVLYGGAKDPDTPYADTWFYSDTGWMAFAPANNPGPRVRAMMAAAPGGEIEDVQFILFSGQDGVNGKYLGDTWRYIYGKDGGNWQVAATTGPSPRSDASMVLDVERDVVVLFGGLGEQGYLNDTWIYTNDAWQLWTPAQR